MKRLVIGIYCVFALTAGCANNTNVSPDPRESLIENLSRDLSEINLIVENARKVYRQESLKFTILDAWSLTRRKQVEVVGRSKAKIYNVIQKSTIEIPTQKETIVVDVSKIQVGEEKIVGVATPGRVVAFGEPARLLAEAGGYPIRLYDSALKLDSTAIEAIDQYVTLTSTFENTAKIVLEKVIEIQEKYKDSSVSIERFNIHFPLISIDIQFKFRPF